jgi:hypothetical protein
MDNIKTWQAEIKSYYILINAKQATNEVIIWWIVSISILTYNFNIIYGNIIDACG